MVLIKEKKTIKKVMRKTKTKRIASHQRAGLKVYARA